MKKAFFNWSSGKDAALALYKIQQQEEFLITTLLTNVNKDYKRISMHGLRESLLDAQVASLDLPLKKLYFPADVNMELYNSTMKSQMMEFVGNEVKYSIFGDIFLEDLKNYRDSKLAEVGLSGVYPLWKQNTKKVLQEFLDLGFKAITVCVNAKLLGKEFVGRIIDEEFVKDLPNNVDVCGENGEFHTFVFDGPIFKQPVNFKIGEKVLKSYTLHEDKEENCHTSSKNDTENYDTSFWYCDLI
ncbi:Dph6-related ATP pyrophosphatase [Tenacibaculum geojense]|uniref:Diphthine--ammonia ligase n=1 Tax=Tenacibaculum geojense TaxID=915352 RepID=A0ABW3JS87_9FLAO